MKRLYNLKRSAFVTNAMTLTTGTALAQIMNYWRWPERGTGLHHDSRADTLFVDFSKSVYDWDNMAITYTPDTPQVKIDAVARLMYDCGIALNMNYILNSRTNMLLQ